MFQFGFGNFGFNFQGSAAIQDLLNRADLKLEDLLDEEAVSHEVKTQNQKLLDFLLDPENFKKLVTYCISEPEIDDFDFDQKKCYKYPFVCAEVLSSESQNVVNEFFKSKGELEDAERAEAEREKEIEQQYEEAEKAEKAEQQEENKPEIIIEKSEKPETKEEDKTVESNEISGNDEALKIRKDKEELVYLAQLFSILDGKDLNLTCAGYFSKIANNLFSKKPSELLAYIYKTKTELLDKMVEHIQSKSIAELLARLLTFETPLLSSPEDPAYNDERVRIFKIILKKLEPECDIEEINNSAYLICEVFGKYNTMHGSQEVLGKILERPVIDSLFETLAKKSSISSCATALVLGNIFAYYILINTTAAANALTTEQPTEDNKVEEQPIHTASNELSSEIPLIAAFLDNLKFIIDYVASPTNPDEVSTQFGTSITPFGAARLKFLELLIISMKASNKDIYAKLVECNFFESLLKLIQHYEWNNMLHNQIEKVIGFVLDAGNDELKAALLDKASLLDFIVDASKEDKYTLKGKHERKVRKGYMGHVIKIANRILESKDPIVEKHTQGNAKWTEYVNGQLAETNTKYQTNLGGKDPRAAPENIGATNVQLELPSIMEKFTKFFLQPKLEQKDLEEEVIDDGDADTLKEKEEKMLHDSIPKDEITILEEKGEVKSDEAASNEDAPPSRGRASFGVKNNAKVGGNGDEEEDDSNTLWFSDPAPKKEEESQEKKEETPAVETKAESGNPDLENEIQPKDEAHKGEEQITSLSHALESHTAMDLLNESEHHHKE